MSQGQNVTVDVLIGSKCHCGRSELGRFVQASRKHRVLFINFYGKEVKKAKENAQWFVLKRSDNTG